MKVTMYADDTSVCFSSGSVDDNNKAINEDLKGIKIWFKSNKLSLNVLKAQGMLIGKSKRLQKLKWENSTKPSFQIGNNKVKVADNTKYLGVQVDQFLNWNQHIAIPTKRH